MMALVFVVQCAETSSTEGAAQKSSALALAAEFKAASYRVDGTRGGMQTAERAWRLTEILVGSSLPRDMFETAYENRATEDSWLGAPLKDNPKLVVRYDGASDDLIVQDIALEEDVAGALSSPLIGEKNARAIFSDYLERMETAGLIGRDELDLENVDLGWTKLQQGIAGGEQSPVEIVDYRFRAHRKLGDVPVKNALVRVTVSRAGIVTSLRILRGKYVVRSLGEVESMTKLADCSKRFAQEFPKAVTEHHGMYYFLPADSKAVEAVVEPECLFSFVGVTSFGDGERKSVSRRMDVRYSAVHPERAGLLVGATPDPADVGDSRKEALQDR
jgi:hypothetical protein